MIWLLLLGLLLLFWTPWFLLKRLEYRHRKRKQYWRKNGSLNGRYDSITRMLRLHSVKTKPTAELNEIQTLLKEVERWEQQQSPEPSVPKAEPVDDWAQLQKTPSVPPKSEPAEFDEWDRLRNPEPETAPAQTQQTATVVRKLPPLEYHWLKKNHRLNIQAASQQLKRLREYTLTVAPEDVLKIAIGTLRRTKPFVFEELLLHCFKEQGWQIMRNERYTGDDGIDGRLYRDGKLYFVQAKRYSGHIEAAHLREFEAVIQEYGAAGGFFVHTGRTGDVSKGVLRQPDSKIILLSGMGVVDLVLGREVLALKL
jgi:restriction system protein